MSNTRTAWRISRRSISMISPLGLAGVALVAVISPDSPPLTVAAVGLFVVALCYVLARVVDDIRAHHAAAEAEAWRHRETLAKQLYGAVCKEALSWIGAHHRQVERFEHAAEVLETYRRAPDTYGPPSDGLHLRAVRDHERDKRISPSA